MATDQTLDTLKSKYSPVLRLMEQKGVKLSNVHVQDGKLVLRGTAKDKQTSDEIWNQIKLINPSYQQELMAEIDYDRSAAAAQGKTYTVKAGDTLSKISKQFYGDANQYQKIFTANRDQLKDPDKIQPGQVLKIP
ncbi:MAG: LysM peptidoglycan-binding domain-containing protein [Acidobacteriota bacterium]